MSENGFVCHPRFDLLLNIEKYFTYYLIAGKNKTKDQKKKKKQQKRNKTKQNNKKKSKTQIEIVKSIGSQRMLVSIPESEKVTQNNSTLICFIRIECNIQVLSKK